MDCVQVVQLRLESATPDQRPGKRPRFFLVRVRGERFTGET